MRRTALILVAATCLTLTACNGAPADQPSQAVAPAAASAATMDEAAPLAVSTSSASMAGTCQAQIGDAAAQRLVERCLAVSPATHPPCNAQNTCEIIQGEIDRACALYGPDETKPKECAA
ncbi:MAG: hypothetical protein ACTHLA_07485 [Asticcacaulis sp.]|uniref:hypothetical protein n=1 Tax=Asticcacaulis sp. TaxID=1872648 RepID=UPI003F7BF5D6